LGKRLHPLEAVETVRAVGANFRSGVSRHRRRVSHHRQFRRPCPSVRRRRTKRGGDQALGRSRGGFTTKINAVVDALGMPLKFKLTPGQASDYASAEDLILAVGVEGKTVIADKGYDSDAFVETIVAQGGQALIPWRKNRTSPPENRLCDWHLYKERHLVECFFNKFKNYRRIATRYDKLATTYMTMILIAATLIWLKIFENST
jgi:transposase